MSEPLEWERDGYLISTDRSRIDIALVHRFLSEDAYWSLGIPRHVVERAVDNSLCFGLYRDDEQVGFARAVTDRAVYAYVGDVFVVSAHRGRGLGVWLVETLLSHPDLQGLRALHLATEDAHALYERFGFRPLGDPRRYMAISRDPGELYG